MHLASTPTSLPIIMVFQRKVTQPTLTISLYFIPWDSSSGRPHGGNSVARRRKIQESGEEKGSHNASSNILANHSVQHFATNRASKWGCWKLWNIHLLEESLIKRLMFRYLSSITYLDIKTKGEFTYPMLDYD